MRKITQKALTVTAAAAAAVSLTALPAWAWPTGSVSLPGVSTSPAAVTGSNDGNIVGLNTTRWSYLTCTDLDAEGTVQVGTGLSAAIGSMTQMDLTNCTAQPGSVPTVVVPLNLPWGIEVTGPSSGGVTPGKLTGVKVELRADTIGCRATVSAVGGGGGYIEGEHTNPASAGAPSTLSLPPTAGNNLVVTSIDPNYNTCPTDLIGLGDTVGLSGTVNLEGVSSTGNEGPTVAY